MHIFINKRNFNLTMKISIRIIFFLFLIMLSHKSGSCQNDSLNNSLTILSWNVKFLPRILAHIGHQPMKRVPLIAEKLITEQYDILVFQEAFDRSCNKKLIKLLKPIYPYVIGPANQKPGFKVSSGIMIMSKLKLKELGTIDFKECEKEDCMARKGALLVETIWKGITIQILGTHLEAGGSKELKTGQYTEIANLLDKYVQQGVPQFVAGDFNTHKESKDTTLYNRLIRILKAEDGPLSGELQFTSDHALNDMDSYNPNRRSVIDFIFYRANGVPYSFMKREVIRYQQRWGKKNSDLSDHFAVKMTVVF